MSDPRTLLPPSASALSRAIETVMAERTDGIEAPIGTLWNVDTCPAELLPWLAWAFSVEVWESGWSEAAKREVIRDAIQVHRLKGTRGAVEQSLASLGMDTTLVEWFEDGAEPHTFRIDVLVEAVFEAGFHINPELVSEVERVLHNVKPVRSHYSMRLGERMETEVYARAGVGAAFVDRATHDPEPRTTYAATTRRVSPGVRAITRSRVDHDVLPRIA